jgi:hypothetical protein
MKILSMIKEKLNGIALYRSVIPHSHMIGRHDVRIHFTDNIITIPDKELETFDIIHASYAFWGDNDRERLRRLGVKLIIDIDDYWHIDRFHELYDYYEKEKRPQHIKDAMGTADAITTTTDLLAKMIRPFNKTVGVFNNVLMDDDFYAPRKNEVPFCAWVGGNCHTADLMLIQHLQKGNGFPVFVPDMYRDTFKDRFLYYEGQPIPNYLGLYNAHDIVLVALRQGEFNKYKSPLKVMESGFFKKAIIVSDVDPYSQYLKHKENCLAVRKHSEWARWCKLLINDAAMRNELGNNLYKDVMKNFNLLDVNKKRFKFYQSVLESPENPQ